MRQNINVVTKFITEEEEVVAQEQQVFDENTPELIRAEVERRIREQASLNTQINLAGAVAAGLLTPLELVAFTNGLNWISAMRAKGAELASNQDLSYKLDTHWPAVPADAAALAALY